MTLNAIKYSILQYFSRMKQKNEQLTVLLVTTSSNSLGPLELCMMNVKTMCFFAVVVVECTNDDAMRFGLLKFEINIVSLHCQKGKMMN